MRTEAVPVRALTKAAFAPYGEVVEIAGAERRLINQGSTERFHNLASVDVADGGGRPIVSIFRGQPFAPPIDIVMMERHPLGSQMFYPLSNRSFLVIVAPERAGRPGTPEVFICPARTGVNYAKNVWHHPLVSLGAVSDFLIVDRDGPGDNLEEHTYAGIRYRIDAIAGAEAESEA